jgi:DNA-binding protein H-NS
MDISRMALAELQQLLQVLPKEIEKRRAQQRALVKEELVALARARGFKLEEILALPEFDPLSRAHVADPVQSHRPSVPTKYRHPLHAELAWSGRGKTPRWVDTWVAEGRSMQELLV